jgi:hypothetical protein
VAISEFQNFIATANIRSIADGKAIVKFLNF